MPAHALNIVTKTKKSLADICVRVSGSYWERSWQSRWNRRAQNLANWNAYHSRQDWSHKLPWQTQQTVADFGISIEQATGTLERGLTDTEDWLTADAVGIGDPAMDPESIAHLLKYYLLRLWQPGDAPETSYNIANLTGDGVKRGLLESILTGKVYAKFATKYQYRLVQSQPRRGKYGFREDLNAYDLVPTGRQKVVSDPLQDFRLCVELIPWEDWFPDPSLLNKYVIHEVTMHMSELAANPDFDPAVVKSVMGTANATYADMYKRVTQDIVFIQHDPDEVRVREYWGDLIDPDTGEVLATNSFWTMANGQLLRPPTPNPFWHNKRPFVSAALLRTPNSTIHKALSDDAVNHWQFLNELVSLMFDGALAAVWGKGQMRSDFVENSDDFTQGIPQAATFLLRPNTPEGYKAWEKLDSGELPAYAIEIFNLAMRQFQTAMATNDLKLGQQPPKEATATCVPMWTEALTRDGWKGPGELRIGEEVLGFNAVTQQYEWTCVEAINRYAAAPTILYENHSWKAVCTANHRWVSQRYNTRFNMPFPELEIHPIVEMNTQTRIITTAVHPAPDGPGLGSLAIDELLDRANLVSAVLKMTHAERQAFIVGCLVGKGHTHAAHGSGRDVVLFVRNEGPVLDAFRLASFLEGIRTSSQKRAPQPRRDGGWTNGNCSAQLFWHSPVWRQKLTAHDAGEQPVWCPTTTLGTWVMRQGDTITITGNSIVEAMQAAGSLFESIAARLEDTFLEPLFELAWQTILQYEFDHKFVDPALVQILGPQRVLELTQMTNEERFVILAQSAKFKVRGLRGVTARNRTLTKLVNLLQLISQSPDLLASYKQTRSLDRLMDQLILNSGIDPTTLEKTQQEKDQDEAAQMAQEATAGVMPPGANAPPSSGGAPSAPTSGTPPANGGSPPAMVDAGQGQNVMSGAMASKTPSGSVPGAPQPGVGALVG